MTYNNPMTTEEREKLGEKVRQVFLKHQPCAFRTDLNIKYLDCLRYMEEEIVDIFEKEQDELAKN